MLHKLTSPCIYEEGRGVLRCRVSGASFREDRQPIFCPHTEEELAATEGNRFPKLRQQAWNLATSLAAFVSDGLKTVSKEEYRARLAICDVCEYRRNTRCLKCGCRLSLKARGRAFKCPAGKWPIESGDS